MNLEFSHKPNYFLFAQLFIRHLEQHIKKHPNQNQASFDLRDIYKIFQHDFASTTTNLEGILNISDDYRVETINGDEKLIQHYKIDAEQNHLHIDFNPAASQALKEGKPMIEPDASIY